MDFFNLRTTILQESLNSPEEFYLTDDTKLPIEIYAAYEYDGIQYGISAVETNKPRVYELKLYKISGKVKKPWFFQDQKHLRVGLATALKFAETIIPFVKSKADGFIVPIPGKYASEKFNKFATLMVRKSYIKTFKHHPVVTVSDKHTAYNNLFIAKKQINPKQIFKSKSFNKWDFNVGIPQDLVSDIEPKKIEKKSASTKRLLKLGSGYEISLEPTEKEVLDKVVNLDVSYKNLLDDPAKEEVTKETLPKFTDQEFGRMIALSMPKSFSESLLKYGFDESKVKLADFNYSFKQDNDIGVSKYKKIVVAYIKQEYNIDVLDQGWENPKLKKKLLTKWLPAIASYLAKGTGLNISYHLNFSGQKQKAKIAQANLIAIKGSSSKSTSSSDYKVTKKFEHNDISVKEFKSTVAGVDPESQYDPTKNGFNGWDQTENTEKKMKYILNTMKYGDHLTSKGLSQGQHSAAYKYTGSYAYDINETMRNNFTENFFNDANHKPDDYAVNKYFETNTFKNLSTAFDAIEPVQESFWVYRGATYPYESDEKNLYPGNDYIDPAFMSTAIHSSNTFGMDNLKLIIFIPKGSKVLPVFSSLNGAHANEKEVILPPFSVIKIVKYTQVEKYGKKIHHVEGVFTGTAKDDILKDCFKRVGKTYMTEAKDNKPKKDEKYDVNKKFGGVYNDKVAKAIAAKIKTGKYTVKK